MNIRQNIRTNQAFVYINFVESLMNFIFGLLVKPLGKGKRFDTRGLTLKLGTNITLLVTTYVMNKHNTKEKTTLFTRNQKTKETKK